MNDSTFARFTTPAGSVYLRRESVLAVAPGADPRDGKPIPGVSMVILAGGTPVMIQAAPSSVVQAIDTGVDPRPSLPFPGGGT